MNKLIEIKLKTLKEKNKIPNVILFTGVPVSTAKDFLMESAQILSGDLGISEAKGALVLLETEDESIKIEQVRDLIKKVQLKNWEIGKYRFVLIHQAAKLTTQSSNALLKSLEEPQGDICYLLSVPTTKNLLPTLISRSLLLRHPIEYNSIIPNQNNLFKKAFFEGDCEKLASATKPQVLEDWRNFNESVKEEFVSRVYQDEFLKEEWFRLFEFLDQLDTKIEAHMDTKWIGHAIERFNFNDKQ